jgi:hypothetical protein
VFEPVVAVAPAHHALWKERKTGKHSEGVKAETLGLSKCHPQNWTKNCHITFNAPYLHNIGNLTRTQSYQTRFSQFYSYL